VGQSHLLLATPSQPDTPAGDLDYASTSALALNSGSIKDAAGNDATLTLSEPGGGTSLGSNKDIVVDGVVPTLSSLSPADDATDASPNSNLTITFSEDMTTGSGDLILKKSSDDSEYESIGASSDKITISGAVATINPAKDMEVSTNYYVTVASGMFKDGAGNEYAGFSDATSWNFTTSAEADVTAPSAASAVVYDGTEADVDTINTTRTIKANWSGFTDEVGIASYDWAIGSTSGGTEVQDWTSVGNVTTAEASDLALASGTTYYVSVRAVDGAGNVSDVVTSDGATVLVAGPMPTISTDISEATNTSPILVTVTFSLAVTGFESEDVTVGNATLSGFSGSGSDYSFYLTPLAEGKATVDINENVAQDAENVGNPAANQYSFIYDITAPTTGTVSDGEADDVDYQISLTMFKANWSGFSDELSGISKYEWSIKYSTGLIVADLLTWTETGLDTTAMDSTLTLEEGKAYFAFIRATDKAGNVSNEAFSDGVTITQNAPTAALSADVVYATNTSPFTVFVNFSSDVTGFDLSDVTVSNGTADVFTGSGKEYSFEVTPTDEGQVLITVGDGVAQDADGIGNVGGQFTMIYDITNPLAGSVIDGIKEDLDWSSAPDGLTSTWMNFSDSLSGIGDYEYSIGRSVGSTNVLDWASSASDTTVTATGLSLTDGTTYYISVHAVDRAGNVSPDSTSNGVTVDFTPPKIGIVHDGDEEDVDRTTSFTTLSANWTEFEDELSGIAFYEYAIGIGSDDTSFVGWTTTGLNTFYSRDDLTLEVDTVYYHSVRARDVVGNISDPIVSDGITVDQSPPALLAVSPDKYSPLPVTASSEIIITFTEPIDSFDLIIESDVLEDFSYSTNLIEDSLFVTLAPPLASMDTLTFKFRNVTDLVGFVTDEISLGFNTEVLADYNSDEKIDVSDLSLFVGAWTNGDLSLELGPASGVVPHLIPAIDGVMDIWDISAFTRMWHWSHGNSMYLARSFPNVGVDIDVEQSPQSLNISIPDEAIAGEVVVQYEVSSTDITLTDSESADRILINNKDAESGQIVVDFGYLKTVAKKQFTFDTKYENDPTITLSYIFYGRITTIISMGTREMDLTAVPDEFSLHQNYPNPFNPTTTILYDLPEAATVHLVIYDVLGRQVRTLVNQDLSAGYHKAVWDATDDMGRPLSGGLYIYRIQAGGFSKTMKMVLLK
jgi:hypothetical protein